MENLRAFLESKLGASDFVRDYRCMREALSHGRGFDEVEGMVTGSLREYFPLVMQLIQMEYCTKLWYGRHSEWMCVQ